MSATGSSCPRCGAPPKDRERHVVENIYIFDCKNCGYVFHAKDSWGEFRSAFLTRFINLWRTLKPEREYLIGSLADCVGVTSDILIRLLKRVERRSLNGKPWLKRENHYGIKQVIDERTGEVKLVYRPHPVVLKDMDPEDGEPWPYEIFDVQIAGYEHSEPIINKPLSFKVWIEYCFTSPTEFFIGLECEGRWVACAQQSMVGEGVKEFTLEIPALKKYGVADFRVRAFHKEQDWVEDSSVELKLDFKTVKCDVCGRLLSFEKSFPEVGCSCGKAWYRVENGTVYTLKYDEAFCYDFNSNWAWWWELKCPNCGTGASLEFSSGRWFCSHCGLYVEPKHDYRFFRCILPCGHEHIYSIFYLVKGKSLKCWTCGLEADLPGHVKSAWENSTIFNPLAELAVEGEYFVRKNQWVIPTILTLGLIGIGLTLLAFLGERNGK
jgi:transcription elongation factor Elf1